jgi:hypothetical protein
MKSQHRSLTGKYIDLVLEDGDTYATAEFKKLAGGSVCHWIVSGRSDDGLPAMLLDLPIPMRSTDEDSMILEATKFATDFLFPMAQRLSKTPGAGEKLPELNVEMKRSLFEEHMHHHFSPERAGSLTLQRQTEALFRMATFLRVFSPIQTIAKFQNVAPSTVETRVKKGRASGAIPKASEVRARKEILKKGLDA